jgi:glutamate synthase domain-containing protein 3
VHVPAARKFGLGAMLADGFEIESAGAFVTGGVLMVVVGVGATVVGVTTVVGGGVVVGPEPSELERDVCVEVADKT